MLRIFLVICLGLTVLGAPAIAEQPAPILASLSKPLPVESAANFSARPGVRLAASDCSCRAGGVDYQLGDLICIRGKLAQCDWSLNNTAWKFLSRACPTS